MVNYRASSKDFLEVADIIQDFLDGTGDQWAWDNFTSGMRFKDRDLQEVQRQCDSMSAWHPATKPGHRPSRNGLEAAFWLQTAADQGYAPAQYSLGMAYYGGIAMPLDRYKAMELINQAADQTYAPALRQLSFFYRTGRFTTKDPLRALMYLELAEQFGDQHTRLDRDELVRDIPVAQQQLAKKRAQEWLSGRGL